jgi:hypothetical protein
VPFTALEAVGAENRARTGLYSLEPGETGVNRRRKRKNGAEQGVDRGEPANRRPWAYQRSRPVLAGRLPRPPPRAPVARLAANGATPRGQAERPPAPPLVHAAASQSTAPLRPTVARHVARMRTSTRLRGTHDTSAILSFSYIAHTNSNVGK